MSAARRETILSPAQIEAVGGRDLIERLQQLAVPPGVGPRKTATK
jgi:hypothetical protein